MTTPHQPHTDGWQTIETAPKDGTEIVAHDSKTGTSHVTFWNGFDWHDPDNHYYSEAPDFVPTLWFLLPKPQSTAAQSHTDGIGKSELDRMITAFLSHSEEIDGLKQISWASAEKRLREYLIPPSTTQSHYGETE